jgi:hypothetical protein
MAGSWRLAVISKRLWLIVLALLAIPLLAEFNARLVVSRQLFEEEARLLREIEVERDRAQFLTAFERYAQSDAYVEWWARKARMSKGGEVVVVPVTPSQADNPVALPASISRPRDFAGEWWSAFFANLP